MNAPHPVSRRCRYVVGARRCRRVATVEGQLCRAHAAAMLLDEDEDEDEDRAPGAQILELLDRALTGRVANGEAGATLAGALGGLLGSLLRQPLPPPPPMPGAGAPRARPAPPRAAPPPPPPPSPPPDPVAHAREVLGFDADEVLTRDRVQDRKRQLARVLHPDLKGSKAGMARVLAAADVLLARLPA